ncbi:SoxR reducing system RseC family protein [Candidatus Erwinia haradaeae]|uniref:Protein RseC, partial n=1 Tax=Candidatus Erwinia haradaeae TaxID=1922217 RepID=A0A451D3M3_9GAMM|nr:SoxR reducing system RseC family protein [Candidatus Erwinia haradaeae]VFP80264.1 Protein RseC [Candidatus Erwinia haradaeae]
MIKTQATLLSYKNNIATLYVKKPMLCSSCSKLVNFKQHHNQFLLDSKNTYTFIVYNINMISCGQDIKLCINKNVIVMTTFVLYIIPLITFFIFGGILQIFCTNDNIIAPMSFLGGTCGMFIAKTISNKLMTLSSFQPIMIN